MSQDNPSQHHVPASPKDLVALSFGALGVVYGDIGTSPLYALKESFHADWGISTASENILGILSLIFWSLMLVVVVKYLAILLRADHHGQGGILALLTLLTVNPAVRGRRLFLITTLGLFGAALLYGDGMITPAVSVLSAIEGLKIAAPGLEKAIVPLTVAILIALFAVQRRGTASIGTLFGPVILVWFLTIGTLGLVALASAPQVLAALNPVWAVRFFSQHGLKGFWVLSAVVLAVTGGEALYADLGHFGRKPIRLAWFSLAMPALLLNYFGQGALLLNHPQAVENPFYELAPSWFRLPLIAIAAAATVVASQALISASYSLTEQLVNLGFMPRLRIIHTSAKLQGQIFVPKVNSALMVACVLLVVQFKSSSALAAAYGLSVVGTMLITSILFFFVARLHWGWKTPLALAVAGSFMVIECAFLGANLIKLVHGGWVPLVVGVALYLMMSTWRRGRELLANSYGTASLEIEPFLADIEARAVHRVPGTAVFMTRQTGGVPQVLLHHLKHNYVLHKHVVLLSVVSENVPDLPRGERLEISDLGHGFHRVIVRHGFMQPPKVAWVISHLVLDGEPVTLASTSFFLGRETIIPTGKGAMSRWRKRLFGLMSRNSNPALAFFGLPPNRVVELGMQVAL
ncbi:MAG TPA: potassium transporter Kup [Thermoanaerobaculia bacterium]|nr:potassium transporter Kup [Thermoanaerobaculia bacterium]